MAGQIQRLGHVIGDRAAFRSTSANRYPISCLETIAVVAPVASNTPTATAAASFAFVQAMIFNAPLMRINVEPEAVAALATASAVTEFVFTGAGAA